MQLIPSISVTNGQSGTLVPLIMVVLASMIKDAFEDWKRHQNDKKENEDMLTEVYDVQTGDFVTRMWKQVLVGQVVKVEQDKFIPADMILLNSSGPKGICYIETKNLDGETNLKMKSAKKDLYEYFKSKNDLNHLSGELICEEPNDQIYKFEGAIQFKKG